MRSRCVVIVALVSALASEGRAQWQCEPWRSEATLDGATAPDAEENGPAHEPTRPQRDAEPNREAARAIAKPAWVPGARRSRPIMWAGLTLVAVAAAGGFAGAFAHGADNDDPIGIRIAFGSAALGSLAIPLVPLGAQRVGYPHRAPGLMHAGMALTYLGSGLGAASFATWAAHAPRDRHTITDVVGAAGAGLVAIGVPFWAGGSRRPTPLARELPSPEPAHENDALVAFGVGGLTLGVAALLVGSGLVFGDRRATDCRFECEVPAPGGESVGAPLMIAGTALAIAGSVMVAFGAQSGGGAKTALRLRGSGLGIDGSF